MFNPLEDLFAPSRRHTDEERKRLELTRVDLNDGDPGRGPIDLSSGKVVVRPPHQEEPATADDQADRSDGPDSADPADDDAEVS
ncbi:DUF6191 domain-containing protein [Streptomyces sp. NPDC059524]|uniref:DUF6191 domain-containing protein n=1 Tax=Streptomyces sp. NPDC059524 TaxID=3346856 RepID=UPI0036CBB96A